MIRISNNRKIDLNMGTISIFLENYFFPVLFLYAASNNLIFLYDKHAVFLKVVIRLKEVTFIKGDLEFLSHFLNQIAFATFNILVAWSLLIRKSLVRKPEGFLENFIPVLSTFFYELYNFLENIPQKWNLIVIPKDSLLSFYIFGAFITFLGIVISILATLDLKHSYGIFVQVRKIVTTGFYRDVRHPIYLGYIIYSCGLCLLNPKVYSVLFIFVSIFITVFRAIIEERKLAFFSPEYRQYIEKTPFILPLRFKSKYQYLQR